MLNLNPGIFSIFSLGMGLDTDNLVAVDVICTNFWRMSSNKILQSFGKKNRRGSGIFANKNVFSGHQHATG
jgi:hypothetical protein